MGDKTGIAWTDATWNPLRGCTKVSAGCKNCYAMGVALRFSGPGQPYEGLAHSVGGKAEWTNKIMLVSEHLNDPVKWTKPRKVFVNSMSDLFHKDVPFSYVDKVFEVMKTVDRHIYQVLTKRPERMLEYVKNRNYVDPFKHIWLGTSVEDQASADTRMPIVTQIPNCFTRWVSYEPAIGPVDWSPWLSLTRRDTGEQEWTYDSQFEWMVVGGESGKEARPFDLEWMRSTIQQCQEWNIPVFCKQLGEKAFQKVTRLMGFVERETTPRPYYTQSRKGDDPSEWPEDLQVREYPS